MSAPLHPAILFNLAEAQFRLAKYKEAVEHFDTFIQFYSHTTYSSHARARIALAHDLMGSALSKVIALYKNALNRSSDIYVNYEMKLRYVAARNLRRKTIRPEDRELRAFLDHGSEVKRSHPDLQKLLWLVRLRNFIVDGEYQKALSYLELIPQEKLKPSEQRVFFADGAEIVYGLITKSFAESNFSQLVQIWQRYEGRYLDKVAKDPLINYMVGKSYLRLGLFDSFDRLQKMLSEKHYSPARTYPDWVGREEFPEGKIQVLLSDLRISKNLILGNISLAQRELLALQKLAPQNYRIDFYAALIAYEEKNFTEAIKRIENYLSAKKDFKLEDAKELSQVVFIYSEAIYSERSPAQFQKAAEALLGDLKGPGVKDARERISYLLIESLNSEKESTQIVDLCKEFLDSFKESKYRNRVELIKGIKLLKITERRPEGEKLLQNLIARDDTLSHIKELAKSELALVKLGERKI